ncbi:MAG: DUF3955 domain-containing protein [Proteobacteria bacterium]|nr:DUF3955 domain-containing protein [Pseudomonadota bacterium]NBP13436.1 DUF3955 domain-containing protein [bacterium]
MKRSVSLSSNGVYIENLFQLILLTTFSVSVGLILFIPIIVSHVKYCNPSISTGVSGTFSFAHA